jgi:hypothetical protein
MAEPPMRGKLLIPGQRVPFSMRAKASKWLSEDPIFTGEIGMYNEIAILPDAERAARNEAWAKSVAAIMDPVNWPKPKAPALVVLEPPRRKISL